MSKIVFEGTTKDGTPYLIRYPTINDLKEMWRYINELSKEQTYISFQGEEIPLDEERKFLNEAIKSIEDKKGMLLLAESNGKIVGISDIRMGTRTAKHIGVFGISLAKDFRSQGVGRKLMELVMEESIENIHGLRILELECFANNPIAPQLYKSLGFKEYGRLPKGVLHRQQYVDDIRMYYEVKS